MNRNLFYICFLALMIYMGCSGGQEHFIPDEAVRLKVMADLREKQEALPNGDFFAVFKEPLTLAEKEGLAFLYAYMPIGDVTDYPGEFYLENVREAFRAREEMPWGKDIPEVLFRHFVLPVRVNNENMDESRMVFFDELKDRVKGLSLYDAVLEVNHWCHEKVVYTPSDARTSSPLASVRTAYGRCGEESVFTVAALRSVGIPARQVYTPRWAHTDDNHAWVEAWVDGEWYFLGACEPEPVLDMAWFNGPAYRGILMHTKVFGHYEGPEEIMDVTDCYTEINVIGNYAPAAKSVVTVTDTEGKPLEGAEVEFKIYNYAEFYTVAAKRTDSEGKTFLSAGKGDMLVWAAKDGRFGFRKVSFGKDGDVVIALDKKPGDAFNLPMDIVPPVDGAIPVDVTEEQKKANAARLLEEDSIRNKYVATFYTEEQADTLAKHYGLDASRVRKIMLGSRGNWHDMELYFMLAQSRDKEEAALRMLESLSDKDLRDATVYVTGPIMMDMPDAMQDSSYYEYIINPRVDNEMLSPYRIYFKKAVPAGLAAKAKEDPLSLARWVGDSIAIKDNLNPQQIPVLPVGVWEARAADSHSRDIFFVALARSLDIPARIEPVAGKVQYFSDGDWVDVDFNASAPAANKQGKVAVSYKATHGLDNPQYYRHFTIARIHPDGKLQTLNLEGSDLKAPLTLDAGNYLLVSGTRMAKGNVLANLSAFHIEPGKTTNTALVMRESKDDIQVIGNIDAEARFRLAGTGEQTSILNVTGRGYFIIGILGSRQEPTNHAMRDIAALAGEFETWGRGMILLFKDEQGWKGFDRKEFGTLPNTITYGIDSDKAITDMLVSAMKLRGDGNLPVFAIADTFGRVVFVSQGYTIGLGAQMMRVIHKL